MTLGDVFFSWELLMLAVIHDEGLNNLKKHDCLQFTSTIIAASYPNKSGEKK